MSYFCRPLLSTVMWNDDGDEVELLQLYMAHSLTNSNGNYIFLGLQDNDCGGVIYCGLKKCQCRCHSCNGTCGPNNGCACNACDTLLDNFVTAAQEHLKCTKETHSKRLLLGRTSPQSTGADTDVISVEALSQEMGGSSSTVESAAITKKTPKDL